MTEDEKRRQQADLLLEVKEAEQEVAHLQEKAQRVGDSIRQFGEWMQHNPTSRILRADQANHGFLDALPTDRKYIVALNADEAFTLADELRRTSAKLKDLEQRKRRLGLA